MQCGGDILNAAYGGHNCSIQCYREDFQSYIFGIVENQAWGGQYPQSRVKYSGQKSVNSISLDQKNTRSLHYNLAAYDMRGRGHSVWVPWNELVQHFPCLLKLPRSVKKDLHRIGFTGPL